WNDVNGELSPNGGIGSGLYVMDDFYTDENNVVYSASYQVDDDPNINARRVTLNITWTEAE
ncbi:MAG: hypothetical protein ACK2TT_11735, partial [Anaerolineales bacterium]